MASYYGSALIRLSLSIAMLFALLHIALPIVAAAAPIPGYRSIMESFTCL
ncbi:hypothetical protein PI125_g22302 [Phytophthora idaei]|nr:hypothetical protein PI125_g22302 [Phytophthora idaei]KAG3129625.1 hypothetical protein PI126_g20882 [Phytophthora idaei]